MSIPPPFDAAEVQRLSSGPIEAPAGAYDALCLEIHRAEQLLGRLRARKRSVGQLLARRLVAEHDRRGPVAIGNHLWRAHADMKGVERIRLPAAEAAPTPPAPPGEGGAP